MVQYNLLLNQNIGDGVKEFREIDVLLNNAGGESLLIGKSDGTFAALSAASADNNKVVKVNSSGNFYLSNEDTPTDPTKIINGNSEVSIGSVNGDVLVQVAGTSQVFFKNQSIETATDAYVNLGSASKRFGNIYISEDISDGTNSVNVAALADSAIKKHTQNTDTGTNSSTFAIDSGEATHVVLDVSAHSLRVYQNGTPGTLAEFEAGDSMINSIEIGETTAPATPESSPKAVRWDLMTTYVVNAISTGLGTLSGAMRMRGNVNSNAELPSVYAIGDTYRVNTEGIYVGQSCEVGDMLTAIVARETGDTPANTDWTIGQTNVIDAVTFESGGTIVEDQIPLFASSSGKIIKGSGKSLSDYATQTDFSNHRGNNGIDEHTGAVASIEGSGGAAGFMIAADKEILDDLDSAHQDTTNYPTTNISSGGTVISQIKRSGSHIIGIETRVLTPDDIGAPKIYTTPPTTPDDTMGNIGDLAYDGNYIYQKVSSTKWGRTPMATNDWSNL